MSVTTKYLGGILACLLTLLLLSIFLQEDTTENSTAYLWQNNWEVIEYYPAANDENRVAPTRFIKKAGLFVDEFEVSSISSDGNRQEEIYRASPVVKNIFTFWNEPSLSGTHPLKEVDASSETFSADTALLKLYTSRSAKPVELRRADELWQQRFAVVTNRPGYEELVFMLPHMAYDHLGKQPETYRDRRVVIYPTNSYTSSVTLTAVTSEKKLELEISGKQISRKTPQNIIWSDGAGEKVDSSRFSTLERAIKSLQISFFGDEDEVRTLGDLTKKWEESSEVALTIELEIENGNNYEIEIKRVEPSFRINDRLMLLMKSSQEERIYLVDNIQVKKIKTAMKNIIDPPQPEKRKPFHGLQPGANLNHQNQKQAAPPR